MSTQRLGFVLAALATLCLLTVATVSAQARFEFKLGFATLASLIPDVVGQPATEERHNPFNGDGLQTTTTGLMVWRKADNWTAFTNGARTWVNGPYGLQGRLNNVRFGWELGNWNEPNGLLQAPQEPVDPIFVESPTPTTAPAPTVNPMVPYILTTLDIPPGNQQAIYLGALNAGQTMDGFFMVNKATTANQDIAFSIGTPREGAYLRNLGRVGSGNFHETAPWPGGYWLIFDNRYSITNPKTVRLSYRVY